MDPELIEKYQIGRKEYPMSTRNYQTQMDMTLDTLLTGEPYKLRMGGSIPPIPSPATARSRASGARACATWNSSWSPTCS